MFFFFFVLAGVACVLGRGVFQESEGTARKENNENRV